MHGCLRWFCRCAAMVCGEMVAVCEAMLGLVLFIDLGLGI